ncbi:MAG: copper transporter family protein [Nakamurella sp.]
MSVDGLEPLVGVLALRAFRVSADGFLLPLSFDSDDWAEGICIAGCVRATHSAPDPRCTCGLYSLTDLHELRTQYHQADKLLAVVALEGVSVEGAMGWRSQAARVVAIWISPDHRRRIPAVQVAALRANYPAIAFHTDRAEMLTHYPALIPPPHPRRTALAEAARRTVSAIRSGRMSTRSAVWWTVAVAVSFIVMLRLGQPKEWMVGSAIELNLPLWLFAAVGVWTDLALCLGQLLRRGGRVPPVWSYYRPARYTWWVSSAVLFASIPATIALHGPLHLWFLGLCAAGMLLTKLGEVFVLALPRAARSRLGLLARIGVRKKPPRTGVTAAPRRTVIERLGRIRSAGIVAPINITTRPAPPPKNSQEN